MASRPQSNPPRPGNFALKGGDKYLHSSTILDDAFSVSWTVHMTWTTDIEQASLFPWEKAIELLNSFPPNSAEIVRIVRMEGVRP